MTAPDPKPARRIPDEGLYTLHFLNVGASQQTFDIQTPDLSFPGIAERLRRKCPEATTDIGISWPTKTDLGRVYFDGHLEGSFRLDKPTLKGDPDEPT